MKLRGLLVSLGLGAALGCAAAPITRTHQPEAGVRFVEAGGLRFGYLAEGDPAAPLVLLLHGFPDTPRGWDELRPALAEAGFFVVSPFLRGYAPTATAPDGRYDVEALGRDVIALIDAFGKPRADLVGHDWGAIAAYSATAQAPARVRRLVTLVIPHPATLKVRVRDLRRVRHFLALRRRGAARRFAKNDFAGVDELYARWSPTWRFAPADLESIKNSLAAPGSLDAVLGYYRDLTFKTPAFMRAKTQVACLVIAGLDDGTTPLAAFDDRSAFAGEVRVEKLPTGHFPHRERPDLVLPLVRDFLTRPD